MKTLLEKILSLVRKSLKRIRTIIIRATGKLVGIPRLRYYCPACKQRVSSWLPHYRNIGHGQKKLEPKPRRCPNCLSFERTRHFALYLAQNSILESRPRMLHFAPERGLEPSLRSKLKERYVTTDLFMPEVDRKEDITRMTFDDNSFDFIYCSNVLEHIEDDAAAISELFRVLAPGGCAIIQVPIKGKTTYEDLTITDPHERYKHFGQNDHLRLYGEDIEDRLASAGFEVTPFYMLDVLQLEDSEIQRMNLGRRELIHKCIKPKG